MTRRDFFRFFVIGSLIGAVSRKFKIKEKPKKAKFWRKVS
jgi:hypothetical protein